MKEISAVSTADIHIGKHKYGVTNPKTGLDTSVESVLRCFDHLVYYCIQHKVTLVKINGDLSKGKTLSEEERAEFYKRVKKLNDNGITVIILKGNHDGSLTKQNSFNIRSLKVLDLKNTHVIDEPTLITKDSYYVIAMPYIEDVETWVKEYKALRKKVWGTKKKIIVCLHGNVEGVKHHFSELLESDEPLDIPMSLFKNDEAIIAVCCGHQHQHQVLSEKPYVFYSGSLDRVSFAERDQPKGFVHFRYSDSKLKKSFVEVEAKRFIQIEVKGKAVPKMNYKGAVVKVVVESDGEKVNIFDVEYIESKLREAGAEYVTINRRTLESDGTKKFNTIKSTGLSFKKRIASWVDRHVDPRLREQVKKLGIDLVEESQEVR